MSLEIMKQLEKSIEDYAQKQFNDTVRPEIIKWMRANKCKSISYCNGIVFYEVNGKSYSDTSFEDSTEKRREFVDNYINPLLSNHSVMNCIDFQISL